ncbi:MAG: PIG-L family deacetylase [Anaerolineae bacterium]|nr:PIG-L family deacetylase [Thermoflexales bacterium]MDW8408772.1 PIG-L family deacetylase [Anaerolineae bacterium]
MKTLLAIFAHPDDESFGIGGTLAKYAHEGVAVYYLCGTRGESGTVDPAFLRGYADVGALRSAELECASRELGLAGVRYLGFRDSGMPGAPDNRHPNSLFCASVDAVAERIIAHITDVQPDVVITHDKFGGYGHPDHIKLYHATLRAYEKLYGLSLGDDHTAFSPTTSDSINDHPSPALHRSSHQSSTDDARVERVPRLYVTAFPKGMLKVAVRLLPLLGQNPRQFGRNKDIDLVTMSTWVVPVTTRIPVRAYIGHKERASACHLSQQPVTRQGNLIVRLLFRRANTWEAFSRLYPPVKAGEPIETDLFGV